MLERTEPIRAYLCIQAPDMVLRSREQEQDDEGRQSVRALERGLDSRRGEAKFTGYPFAPSVAWDEFKAEVPTIQERVTTWVDQQQLQRFFAEVGHLLELLCSSTADQLS